MEFGSDPRRPRSRWPRQQPPANRPRIASSAVAGNVRRVGGNVARWLTGPSIYYDTSAERRKPWTRSDLARACRRPNVAFRISDCLDLPAPAPPVGVSVRIVPHQAGSPVSIVESMSPLDDGYASVVVRDDADKAIRSVTLAALVRPSDPAMTTPQVFIRRGPSVISPPARNHRDRGAAHGQVNARRIRTQRRRHRARRRRGRIRGRLDVDLRSRGQGTIRAALAPEVLLHPAEHHLMPPLAVERLQHPVALVGKHEHL